VSVFTTARYAYEAVAAILREEPDLSGAEVLEILKANLPDPPRRETCRCGAEIMLHPGVGWFHTSMDQMRGCRAASENGTGRHNENLNYRWMAEPVGPRKPPRPNVSPAPDGGQA
jgi:hypothetical protein